LRKKIISFLKYLIFIGIGVLLLWQAFKGTKFDELIVIIKNAKYSWVALAMFCGTLSHISRAIRWNMLIKPTGHNPMVVSSFFSVMIGYLANLAFPRLGEVVRCTVLSRREKIPFNTLLGTVVVERAFDLLSLLLLIFLTIVFQFDFLREFLTEYIYTPYIVPLLSKLPVFLIILVVVLAGSFFLLKAILPIIKKNKFFFKIKRLLVGFIAGLRTIKQLKSPTLFFAHTVFIWSMYLAMSYLCFFAVQETAVLDLKAGITILVIGSIGITLPVPGGIGPFHYFVINALTYLYNITDRGAEAYAIITHTSQMLLIALLGVISLILFPIITGNRSQNDQSGSS